MEKVKISKKQAEIVEKVKETYNGDVVGIIENHFRSDGDFWAKEHAEMRKLTDYEVVAAFCVGYEIEETPQEAIKRKVEKSRTTIDEYAALDVQIWHRGYIEGIRYTLDTLGIEIEGVNA